MARLAGLSRSEFGDVSIRELFHELAMYVDRKREERDRAMTLAWHIAALSRQERLPSLDRLLGHRRRQQSLAQQRMQLETILGPGKKVSVH